MKKNLMVTVSGGRSSAMMARHIQTSEKYKDFEKIYVFANTGQERQETIDFLKNIVKFWEIDLNIVEAVGCSEMGSSVSKPSLRVRFYPKDTDETYDGTVIEETQYSYLVAPDDNLTGTARWNKKCCDILR